MQQAEKRPSLHNLKQRLLKGGIWVTGGFAINALAALAIGALLTRILPPEDVGLYFLAFSLVLTLSSMVQFGMNRTVVRLAAESITSQAPGRARSAIFKTVSLVTTSSLILAILLSSDLGNWLATTAFKNSRINDYLPILIIWFSAYALRSIIAESFRGLHNIKMAALGQRILPNLLIVSGLTAIWIGDFAFSLSDALILAATAAILVFTYTGIKLYRQLIDFPQDGSVPLISILRSSFPLFISQTLSLVMAQAPIWILGATQTEHELALFGTAIRVAIFTSMPLLITNAVLMPMAASLHSANQHDKLARLLDVTVSLIAIPSSVIFVLIWFSGADILELVYGEDYRGGSTTLLILSFGSLLNVYAGSSAVVLAMSGNEHRVLRSAFFSSLLSIGAGFIFIPIFGSVGAATTASLGLIVYNIFLCWHCNNALGLRTYISMSGFKALYSLARNAFGGKNTSDI
jgi:O-antigen/teichoic acid export membrane protein